MMNTETYFLCCVANWMVSIFLEHLTLPSARQHPSYGDYLEVKREYVTQCSQSTAHLCEQFLQLQQIGFITLGPLRCA